MKEVVYIFIGGGLGSVMRYLVQLAVNERMSVFTSPFGWGTFTVNIIGSLLIGLSYSLSERLHLSIETRLFLTAGLCGGFTTFSTFSADGLGLLKGEFYATFFLYTILSIVLGLAAALLGGWIGKQLG